MVLEDTGANASWLVLEVTEGLLADTLAAMVRTLQELRNMKSRLSFDDFATGSSGLSYLQGFPITEIKVDKSFVSTVDLDQLRYAIAEATSPPDGQLEMPPIVEVHYGQAYFLGCPMSGADFMALADRNPPLKNDSQSRVAIVIDDDPLVRETLSETLEHLDWTVTSAGNAEDVIALPESFGAPHVVITDVNLGAGMDGFEFADVARSRWPSAGIVVISGRPAGLGQLASLRGKDVFLQKPVSISALEAAIARVTGG